MNHLFTSLERNIAPYCLQHTARISNKGLFWDTQFRFYFFQMYTCVQARCEGMSANLLEVKSLDVDQFVASMFKPGRFYRNHSVWTGLNDIAEEGNFTWASNQEPASFFNWKAEFLPDNVHGNEDCVHLWVRKEGDWKTWNDNLCSRKMPSVCQIR